ncbi:MAG: hypothetical protein FWE01_03275 [Firmicutes bacterium]|nr:hypothetical protein [Bacillota bacterium]
MTLNNDTETQIKKLLEQLQDFETKTLALINKLDNQNEEEQSKLIADYLTMEQYTSILITSLQEKTQDEKIKGNANQNEHIEESELDTPDPHAQEPTKDINTSPQHDTKEQKDIEHDRAMELASIISGKAGASIGKYNAAINALKRVHSLEYQAITAAGSDKPQQLMFRIKMSANSPYINIRHMDFVNRHNVQPISRNNLLSGRLDSQDGSTGRQFARGANSRNNSKIAEQLDARPDLQILTLLHMMGNGGKNRRLGWQPMLVNRNSMLETLRLTQNHRDIGTYPELESYNESTDEQEHLTVH